MPDAGAMSGVGTVEDGGDIVEEREEEDEERERKWVDDDVNP